MWFLVSFVGYFLLGLTLVMDKMILTKSIPKPAVYTFDSLIYLLAFLALVPFGVQMLIGLDWGIAFVTTGLSVLALLFLYMAVKRGEASHMFPFVGGVMTITLYVIELIFFHVHFTVGQTAGIALLIGGILFLSFEKTKTHAGVHIGFVWAIISGFFYAVSTLGIKYLYTQYDFLTAFVWIQGLSGVCAFFLLLLPSVRAAWIHSRHTPPVAKKRKGRALFFTNKIVASIAFTLLQYAISIGNVTLVTALGGLQYVWMFLLVIIFTKFFPRLFREYVTRREVTLETIGVFLVLLGSIFFVP